MLNQKTLTSAGADRRQFGRRSAVWHAWIVTGPRQRIACCIRNVSSGGALLELVAPATLPQKFDLLIEDRQLTIRCDLKHRGEHGIGVSFADVERGRDLYALSSAQPERQAPRIAAKSDAPSAMPARPRLLPDVIAMALHQPE